MNSNTWLRTALLSLPLILLAACTSSPRIEPVPQSPPAKPAASTVDTLTLSASQATEPRRSQLYLQAATTLGTQNSQRTLGLLSLVDTASLSNQEIASYLLLNAALRIDSENPRKARDWLDTIYRPTLNPEQKRQYDTLQATLANLEGNHREAVIHWDNAINSLKTEAPADLYSNLWQSLLQENSETLKNLLNQGISAELKPWLELAIIYRSPEELTHQLEQLEQWQNRWAGTAAYRNMPKAISTLQTTPAYQPRRIALLLPVSGPQSSAGEAVRDGFMAGYYQALTNNGALPEVSIYDTFGANAAELAQLAQNEGAELIIGPLGRNAVRQSLENSVIKIPQLILNQIPEQTAGKQSRLYQFGLSSEYEARLAAERAWQDGYRRPIIISPDNEWGNRVVTTFRVTWEELGGQILSDRTFTGKGDYNSAVSEALLVNNSIKRANSLTRLLGQKLDYTPRRREDVDMVFIVGTPSQGRQLKPALDFYFAYNLPVYTVSSMYSGEIDSVQDRDLNDVRIPLMPWLVEQPSTTQTTIQKNWGNSEGPLAPLYALGSDAWRIYPRLEQLTRSEGAQMFGATGTLSISSKREVERELGWFYFRNGRPTPLSRERSMHPNKENVLESESSQFSG